MKQTNPTQTINAETKADQLIEVAKWLKKQNHEFTKNFSSMRSIIRFYLQLPYSYDKSKSITAFVNKNLNSDCQKWDSYIANKDAQKISLIANTLFGFRYFEKAPYKWALRIGLYNHFHNGKEITEVILSRTDRCNIYDFAPMLYGDESITIQSTDEAKVTAKILLNDASKTIGNNDYEIIYSKRIKELIEEQKKD